MLARGHKPVDHLTPNSCSSISLHCYAGSGYTESNLPPDPPATAILTMMFRRVLLFFSFVFFFEIWDAQRYP